MEWYIGDIKINNQIVMAPMAGISNSSYRKICKEMGVGLIYAEMVSDKALVYQSKKTIDMLYMEESERPIAQQIFGADKEDFVKAAKFVYENQHPDIIDINMGCPVPKVAIKSQAGSALLKNPNKVKEIVSAVVESVPIPVTVKIRSGWDKEHINAVEIAKVCESAGAKAICVHGRTRSEGYSGHSDWNIIKQVKEAVSIPVIGNGDVKSCYDAKRMLEETGCDAVMIGRGLLGNPWLIKECIEYIDNNKVIDKPTIEDKIDMCIKHLESLKELKSEHTACLEIRNHIGWYLKGINGSNEIKNQVYKMEDLNSIKNLLLDYKESFNTK